MDNSPESREETLSATEILRETAERFRILGVEAEAALTAGRDAKTYSQKLRERAQLLIDLPNRLPGRFTDVDKRREAEILKEVLGFAGAAKDALEDSDGSFLLGALLSHKGDKLRSKNDIERLVDSLRNKRK